MKSFLSLLMMLVVVAAVLAGGYWLYTQNGGQAQSGSHTLSATDSGTTLTLQNNTAFGLTVELKGPALVQFAIMPGKSQKRSIAPGTYEVRGTLSDPTTDGFGGSWKFEEGHQYNAGFTRSEKGGSNELVGGLIQAQPPP
jgi:hypothetical protein